MAFTGSCHCGAITYSVEEDTPGAALSCNCSICRRRGALHHFTTPDKFAFNGSRDDLASYRFNSHVISHLFCRTCGCAPFGEGTSPDGQAMVEINLRCVDDIDLEALQITAFDGARL